MWQQILQISMLFFFFLKASAKLRQNGIKIKANNPTMAKMCLEVKHDFLKFNFEIAKKTLDAFC